MRLFSGISWLLCLFLWMLSTATTQAQGKVDPQSKPLAERLRSLDVRLLAEGQKWSSPSPKNRTMSSTGARPAERTILILQRYGDRF